MQCASNHQSQRIEACGCSVQHKDEENFVILMPNTIVNPNTVVVHFQNTSLADTTMMRARRFIMRTLLAVSQITTLALDLMEGGLGVLDVGHEGGRHAARVARDDEAVGGDAGERERGVGRDVGDPGRRGEPQPRGDREEHRGVVDVPDRGEHRDYRQRDVPRPPRHPSSLAAGEPRAAPRSELTEAKQAACWRLTGKRACRVGVGAM